MRNSPDQSPYSAGEPHGRLAIILGLLPPAFLAAAILFLPLKTEVSVLVWLVAGFALSATCCSVVANLFRRRKTIWTAVVRFLVILDGAIAVYLGIMAFGIAYSLW